MRQGLLLMPTLSSSHTQCESMTQSMRMQPQSSNENAVSPSTNSLTNSSRIAEQKGKAKSIFVISRLDFGALNHRWETGSLQKSRLVTWISGFSRSTSDHKHKTTSALF